MGEAVLENQEEMMTQVEQCTISLSFASLILFLICPFPQCTSQLISLPFSAATESQGFLSFPFALLLCEKGERTEEDEEEEEEAAIDIR